uniref:Uncharacterized protein n=1 Tax=Myotis myotis TaxID=51298 RepID=A0A7J7RVE6_MYOMY|nr:hypothetical protein mMyoMyo1_010168 [Myotis myotis]
MLSLSILFFFKYILLIFFLQRGRERDRELEISMREKHRSAASCTSPTGDVPATQVHALDQNRTWDLSVRRLTLYPLSQTGFGSLCILHSSHFYSTFKLLPGASVLSLYSEASTHLLLIPQDSKRVCTVWVLELGLLWPGILASPFVNCVQISSQFPRI